MTSSSDSPRRPVARPQGAGHGRSYPARPAGRTHGGYPALDRGLAVHLRRRSRDAGSDIGRDNVWTAEIPDDIDEVDAEIAVGCMIETRTAVENVEEILSVPELGFVVIGPSGLSISYGHPFDRDHPEVQAAIDTVREARPDADVQVGGVTDDTDDARTKLEEGYRLLRVGDEVSSARAVLGERLDTLTA